MVSNEQEQPQNDVNSENKIFTVEKNGNSQFATYWLIEPIGSTRQYIDLLNFLDKMQPQDVINIHINCPGGNCDTAFQIYDAIETCQGTVNIWCDGMVASAATFIMLTRNSSINITAHSYIMCHGYSWGVFGKCNEVEAEHKFVEPWMKEKFVEVYKGFLTTSEIDELLNGKDFWFNAEETTKRIAKSRENDMKIDYRKNELFNYYKELLEKEIENMFDEETGEFDESSIKEQDKRLEEIRKIVFAKKQKQVEKKVSVKTKNEPKSVAKKVKSKSKK